MAAAIGVLQIRSCATCAEQQHGPGTTLCYISLFTPRSNGQFRPQERSCVPAWQVTVSSTPPLTSIELENLRPKFNISIALPSSRSGATSDDDLVQERVVPEVQKVGDEDSTSDLQEGPNY